MDLLETVLRAAGAEQYIEQLKSGGLEACSLSLLSDADLEIFGVDDPEVRRAILQKAATLQIPQEKQTNLVVDKEYAELVLNQVSQQLHLHNASLSCAVHRTDVVMCDVELHKVSQCLLGCIASLECEFDKFQMKFQSTRQTKRKKRKVLLVGLTIGSFVSALLIFGKLFLKN